MNTDAERHLRLDALRRDPGGYWPSSDTVVAVILSIIFAAVLAFELIVLVPMAVTFADP